MDNFLHLYAMQKVFARAPPLRNGRNPVPNIPTATKDQSLAPWHGFLRSVCVRHGFLNSVGVRHGFLAFLAERHNERDSSTCSSSSLAARRSAAGGLRSPACSVGASFTAAGPRNARRMSSDTLRDRDRWPGSSPGSAMRPAAPYIHRI